MMLVTRIWLEYASNEYEQTTNTKISCFKLLINQNYVVLESRCGFMGISNDSLNNNTLDY